MSTLIERTIQERLRELRRVLINGGATEKDLAAPREAASALDAAEARIAELAEAVKGAQYIEGIALAEAEELRSENARLRDIETKAKAHLETAWTDPLDRYYETRDALRDAIRSALTPKAEG